MEFTFWLAVWPATDEPAHLMSSILFRYVFYLSNIIYTDYVCIQCVRVYVYVRNAYKWDSIERHLWLLDKKW